MSSLLNDLRYAVRAVRRNPGFSAVAVLLLALGIGANVAIYSVIHAVVLRPLPYPQPDRLVALLGARDGVPTPSGVVSAPDVADYAAQAPAIASAGGATTTRLNLTGAGDPASIVAGRVTPEFFRTLGARPQVGRLPAPEEYDEPVTVLSAATWRSRFGASADVVGRTVRLNDRPVTVVGVLEDHGFTYPSDEIALWIPLASDTHRGSRNLRVVARLTDGADLDAAQRELDLVAERLAAAYPESNQGRAVLARPLHEVVTGSTKGVLLLLFAATGVVLLIACANLGNMLLARAVGRTREFAIRAALGAGRGRMIRQLVTEGFVLVGCGALAGTLAAIWLAELFVTVAPVPLPRAASITLDRSVLAFAFLLAVLTGLASGMIPALNATIDRLNDALSGAGTSAARSPRLTQVGRSLVVIQVALSCALLVGAVLLLQSFSRLRQVDEGFATDGRFAFQVSLPRTRYPVDVDRRVFFGTLDDRLAALPGVDAVGSVTTLPLSGGNLCDSAVLDGGRELEDCVEFRAASPTYFATMGIELLAGRGFALTDGPDAPPIAVVNETLARTAWPGGDPIGRRIELLGNTFDVVGVVEDVRHFGPQQRAPAELYAPLAQATLPWLVYVLRTKGDPAALAGPAGTAVWGLDPELPLRDPGTLDARFADITRAERFRAVLLGTLGGLALLIATLGIYGLLAYLVGTRTRDIGLRMALGAPRSRVLRDIVAGGMALTAGGVVAGLLAALGLTRLLRTFLFDTEPTNPAAYAGAAAAFLIAALLASLIPARRAARIDPMEALRHE